MKVEDLIKNGKALDGKRGRYYMVSGLDKVNIIFSSGAIKFGEGTVFVRPRIFVGGDMEKHVILFARRVKKAFKINLRNYNYSISKSAISEAFKKILVREYDPNDLLAPEEIKISRKRLLYYFLNSTTTGWSYYGGSHYKPLVETVLYKKAKYITDDYLIKNTLDIGLEDFKKNKTLKLYEYILDSDEIMEELNGETADPPSPRKSA